MKNVLILKKKLVPSMVAAALAVGIGAAGVAHAYEGMATQGSDKDRGEKRQGYDKKRDTYKKDKDMDRGADTGAPVDYGQQGNRPDPADATAPPRQIGGPGNER